MATFACPVCGHRGLRSPPYATWPPPDAGSLAPPYEDHLGPPSYEVCHRCAFEFGFDDNPGAGKGLSFDEYRQEWIANGRPWLSERYRTDDGS